MSKANLVLAFSSGGYWLTNGATVERKNILFLCRKKTTHKSQKQKVNNKNISKQEKKNNISFSQ